jgi:hypothetical protein
MNLTWHIVKKDLRALKWPLVVWFTCIATKLGVGVLLLTADGSEGATWFSQMDMLAKGLAVGELLSFVLVAALIQEDLMVGSTAFWMTRPISGGRLLCAKLVGIGGIFLLAPLVITLPWWIGCNYSPGEIAWAAAETFFLHALVVVAALLWSAVTDSLGRFLMWSLITLVSTPMLTASLSYYFRSKGSVPVPDIMSTRLLVAGAIGLVGVAVVLAHQYLTRRTPRSIGLIGATLGLAVLVLAFWPWPWNVETRIYRHMIHRAQGEWTAAAQPAAVKFSLASVEIAPRGPNRPGTLVTRFRVDGLADAQGLLAYPSELRWTWPDGSTEKGVGTGRSLLNGLAADRARAFAKGEVAGATPNEEISVTSLLSAATLAKLRAQPADWTLSGRFRLMQYEATTLVPKQPGKWEQEGAASTRIAAVETSGDEQHVTLVQHAPALWVDLVGGGSLAPSGRFSRYFLVNRKIGWADGGQSQENRSTRIGTVDISWRTLVFHGTPKVGARMTLEGIRALEDAELVKVTYTEQARFSQELAIEAARIAQANP